MRFLADMGLSLKTVEWLREKDHEAIHLSEENLQRLPDSIILAKARDEQRVLLTCDLDFGQLMAASGENLPSVIILRLDNQKSSNQIIKIQKIINDASLPLINGAIISVDESTFRIRHTPIKK